MPLHPCTTPSPVGTRGGIIPDMRETKTDNTTEESKLSRPILHFFRHFSSSAFSLEIIRSQNSSYFPIPFCRFASHVRTQGPTEAKRRALAYSRKLLFQHPPFAFVRGGEWRTPGMRGPSPQYPQLKIRESPTL
jgi:hypothetical protein